MVPTCGQNCSKKREQLCACIPLNHERAHDEAKATRALRRNVALFERFWVWIRALLIIHERRKTKVSIRIKDNSMYANIEGSSGMNECNKAFHRHPYLIAFMNNAVLCVPYGHCKAWKCDVCSIKGFIAVWKVQGEYKHYVNKRCRGNINKRSNGAVSSIRPRFHEYD